MNSDFRGPNGLNGPTGPNSGRRRPNKNTYTTKSGKTIKLHQSIGDRMRAGKNARATRKAAYLSTLPKNPWKRIAYRLNPKRLAAYWFSREGGLMALKIMGVGIVVCFFLAVGVFAYFRKDLPKIKDISGDRLGGSITYYDRSGQTVLWQDYDGVKRIPVEGTEMSPFIKNATVAIEDKDFYKHGAFDVRGIARAGVNDIVKGGAAQGGSTITQQLVKLNQQWTDQRTVTRKVKELILAVELEREYSKNDILTGYLNIAPYGGVEYGVESAARDYFGTTGKNLTLAQAAFLAAIPKSPGIFSPYNSSKYNPSATDDSNFDSQALLDRQHYILDQMVNQHMVTRAEADEAKKVDLLSTIQPLKPKYQGIQAPYFVLSAKAELEQKYGADTVKRGGWRVITSLNMDLQKLAEDKVNADRSTIQRYGGDEAAFVAEDVKTGQVVANVGGYDFGNEDHGFLNFASGVKVSPGSSFKPYDYTSLINYSTNVGAGSVMYDTQGAIPGYPCTNKNSPKLDKNTANPPNCLWDYDFQYPGPLTLRYALGGSRNVPAVKAMLTVGVDKTINMAKQFMGNPDGYTCYQNGVDVNTAKKSDEAPCYGSSAIGDGAYVKLDDHVNGLATISREGAFIPKTYITKINDGSGKPIYEFKQPEPKQIVKPDAPYIVSQMASDPNASYLRPDQKFQHQKNGWQFGVKTGTTNDNFDGLMTSWSTQYAVATWVGYHTRNKAMTAGGMETMTLPITRGWMEAAHANLKPVNWVPPTGIKTLPAFVVRNHVGLSSVEPSPSNDLFPSWYSPKGSGTTAQTTDKVTGRLATSCTPDLARQTLGNSNANTWNVDQWAGGSATANSSSSSGSSSATATDNVHNCSDSPPTITLTAPSNCIADDGGCTITATVAQGTYQLSDSSRSQFPGTVNFIVGGQVVKTATVVDSPSTVSFSYMPTSNGEVTMTAQVVDSVLYSAEDQATFTGKGASPNLTFDTAKINGTRTEFSWTGGAGNYTVYNTNSPGTVYCNNISDTKCSVIRTLAPNNTRVTVKDSNGKTADTTVSN
jgi:membrane peptidoglycan carboxypeptidase